MSSNAVLDKAAIILPSLLQVLLHSSPLNPLLIPTNPQARVVSSKPRLVIWLPCLKPFN